MVYNQEWISYGVSNKYRYEGAAAASRRGGVAALVRSVTAYSQYNPHTGSHVGIVHTYVYVYVVLDIRNN